MLLLVATNLPQFVNQNAIITGSRKGCHSFLEAVGNWGYWKGFRKISQIPGGGGGTYDANRFFEPAFEKVTTGIIGL